MINNVIAGRGLDHATYISQPSQSGAMFWDGNARAVNIVDQFGNRTASSPSTAQVIQLDAKTIAALDWVNNKIAEEAEIAQICAQHPGLADLKEKYELMLTLVRTNK